MDEGHNILAMIDIGEDMARRWFHNGKYSGVEEVFILLHYSLDY